MSIVHSLLFKAMMVLVSCVSKVMLPVVHTRHGLYVFSLCCATIFLQLVYADIDMKKPAVFPRSRSPPPPQGYTTEQDANGPVIYSSVQLL